MPESDWGDTMITMIAVAGTPLLIVVLIFGCAAKLADVRGDSEPGALAKLGPAVLMPGRLRRPAVVVCAVLEGVVAVLLLSLDSPLPRYACVAFFAISTYVLFDLRRRRPDVGCGCFGDVSATPVGLRSIARPAMLTVVALAAARQQLDIETLRAVLTHDLGTVLAWFAALTALLLVLSPELEESVARLRYRAPCAQREMPIERSLSRLRASATWRAHRHLLTRSEPLDVWRELCWRFFSFPGRTADGLPVDVVFAVYLSGRHAPVRGAVVAADGVAQARLPESIAVSVIR
jgi:hypothetical protein